MFRNDRQGGWFMLVVLIAAIGVAIWSAGGCGAGDDDDDDDDDDDSWSGDDDSGGDDDGGDDWGGDDSEDDYEEPDLECPAVADPTTLYLSADDSNSQASPILIRAIIEQGYVVPAGKVRTWEFTNYYDIAYDPPEEGRINVVPQMRERIDAESEDGVEYVFQIGAQTHTIPNDGGRPLNLVFSLDTSGSMGGSSIAYLREVCRAIAGNLQAGDVVSMVEWDSSQNVVLESYEVEGPNDEYLLGVIDGLDANGTTDLLGGLQRAYELATANYSTSRMNRVVLISDGQANTGETEIDVIAQAADDTEQEGIYLVGVGVGEPSSYFNDEMMDAITDAGKGAYVYIDSPEEAELQFGDRFQENMEVAAVDVRVEMTVPYYLIMDEYHGEEYSDDPAEVEPQNLGPNDAMVFHQFLVACDPELVDAGDEITVRARYADPVTREEKSDEKTMTIGAMLAADAPQLVKGDAVVTFAETLKRVAETIDEDPEAAYALCQAAAQKLSSAAEALDDSELADLAAQMDRYMSTVDSHR